MNNKIDELNSIVCSAIDEIEGLKKQMHGSNEKIELIDSIVEGLEMVKSEAMLELLRTKLDKIMDSPQTKEEEDNKEEDE